MKNITFRQATAADMVTVQSFLEAISHQDGLLHLGTAADLARHGTGAAALFRAVLAERRGAPVGVVIFFPVFSTLRGRPGVYVQDLFVTPEARGSGLGKALLAEARRLGRDWGADYMTLMVGHANDYAKDFYATLGFERMAEFDALVLEGALLDRLG